MTTNLLRFYSIFRFLIFRPNKNSIPNPNPHNLDFSFIVLLAILLGLTSFSFPYFYNHVVELEHPTVGSLCLFFWVFLKRLLPNPSSQCPENLYLSSWWLSLFVFPSHSLSLFFPPNYFQSSFSESSHIQTHFCTSVFMEELRLFFSSAYFASYQLYFATFHH